MIYLTLIDPTLVVIEYVPYGDLLGYLRKSRGLNDTYFKDPDVKPQTSLTSQQLMKFSWHVADGMSYLSSRNVSLFCRKSLCPYFLSLNYQVKYQTPGNIRISNSEKRVEKKAMRSIDFWTKPDGSMGS